MLFFLLISIMHSALLAGSSPDVYVQKWQNAAPTSEERNALNLDLKKDIAGKFLEQQLVANAMPNQSFSIKADSVGKYSSDKGILCSRGDNIYYCYFKDASLRINYTPVFKGKKTHKLKDIFLNYGITSDNQYVWGIFKFTNETTKDDEFAFVYKKIGDAKEKTLLLSAVDFEFNGATYNTNTKEFCLILLNTQAQKIEFIRFNLTQEQAPYIKEMRIDNDAIAFITFKDPKKKFVDDVYKKLQWHYIDNNLIGAFGTIYFVYNLQHKTTTRFDVPQPETWVILQDPKTGLAGAYPSCTFIPNYEALLNAKIATCQTIPNGPFDKIYFDFVYLRYLQSKKSTGTIHVTDVLPQKFARALRFMNQTYKTKRDAYDTIDIDAWWVSHAQRETEIFKKLSKDDPIIPKVSPEILKIYPPYSKLTEKPTLKKSIRRQIRSIRYNLGSLWYNTTDWIKKNYLLVGIGTAIAGSMLFGYWQKQKLLYPTKPMRPASDIWPTLKKTETMPAKWQ